MAGWDHPASVTAAGTAAGYLLLLAVVAVVLFVLPYLAFAST